LKQAKEFSNNVLRRKAAPTLRSSSNQGVPGGGNNAPLYRPMYPPAMPKLLIDDSRDPLFLKKSDINIKKAL